MPTGTMFINSVPVVISSLYRRIIQLTCDLARGPLDGLRVLDLACAHGDYSIEMAARGATVVGIEGREEWLQLAREQKRQHGLSNVEFVLDDVRNLSKETYGEFDIVLCLGILYHLDAPDVFEFVHRIYDVCRGFAIFETHFATHAATSHEWRGKRYWGHPALEHEPGTTPAEKLKNLGASLNNENAFWMTTPSLCNLLRHAGFTSVSDSLNPVAHLLVGEDEQVKIWGNRVTLAAIKGQPVSMTVVPDETRSREIDWPEDLEPFLFERVVHSLGKQ